MSHEIEATPSLLTRINGALLIRPGEGRRSALLFTHLLLASAVFVMGRTVRDTLFLSRASIDQLPWMFVLYGIASAITVLIYSRLADRLPRERAIMVWCGIGVVSYLATWCAVRASLGWIYPTFYVWSEVFANLAISQFWTLANELHDPRAAKRLFGTIGAARVLGVIVVGLGAGSIVQAIGTEQLLFVLAALQLGIGALAAKLAKEPRAIKAMPETTPVERRRKPPSILGNRYVWSLSVMLLFAFAALTIGDFQFKAIARQTYSEDALAQFFSYFYAVTGIVSFIFQIFVTPRLLARLGVGAGMSVMPSVFGLASATLLGLPILPVATVMKFADNGFQYTIHDTTLQALYVPFVAATRARTRVFLDAVVKPIAYGLGGLLLLLFARHISVQALSYVSCALVLGWAISIPVVRRLYRRELERTLSATEGVMGLSDEPLVDADSIHLLDDALASKDESTVLAALEEFDAMDAMLFAPRVARVVSHPNALVRVAAMNALGKMGAPAREAAVDVAPIRSALHDPSPEVRASAAHALSALTSDDANDALIPLLEDEARLVRTAALAGLLSHGGLDGAMVGGARLLTLTQSNDFEDRVDAACALESLGAQGFRQVRPLLADPNPAVRRAAVRSARGIGDKRLIEPLIEALFDPLTTNAAGVALAGIGTSAAPRLVALLLDPKTPRTARLQLPRVLRMIPCEVSWQGVHRAASDPDSHLRLRSYAALSQLRARMNRGPLPLHEVRAWILREVNETYSVLAGWTAAKKRFGSPLLDEAIAFREVRGGRRILRILELRYPPEPLRLVRERLDRGAKRGNALELLDNTIDATLRPLVMTFFDDAPVEQKLAEASLPPPPSPLDFMRLQLAHPNPFVVMLALDALTQAREATAITEAKSLLQHADPLVREGAVRALAILSPDTSAELIRPLTGDADVVVARVASAALKDPSSTEAIVNSTVEKLLALRAAPVFAKLRSEDLAVLARVSEIESFDAGQTIFAEGEMGDALFVVVRGAVEIQHEGQKLATLGKGEAFGEMAVLDAGPRSATAVAATSTQALRIGSEAFYDVLHEQVEIAEGIIRVLSARLREANEALEAAKSQLLKSHDSQGESKGR